VIGNFVDAIIRNVRHHKCRARSRGDVDRVEPRSIADDDAATPIAPITRFVIGARTVSNAVGVLAKLGEFPVRPLSVRRRAFRLLPPQPGAPARHPKSVIGDDDLQVSSSVNGSAKSFAHKSLRLIARPMNLTRSRNNANGERFHFREKYHCLTSD